MLARCLTVVGLLAFCCACGLKTYQHIDSQGFSFSYPGNLTLVKDPAALEQATAIANPGASTPPKLSCAVQTGNSAILTFAVLVVPGKAQFSAKTYYEATTARELAQLSADIIEPRTEVVLDGKIFQKTGFLLGSKTEGFRSRLYEHFDPASRRVLVLSLTCKSASWERESPLLESVVASMKLDW